MNIILVIICLFSGFTYYACCRAAARADRQNEEYFLLKMQEKETKNLKND